MDAMMMIKGGDIDKEVIKAASESIIAILAAAKEHMNPEITLKALDIMGQNFDTSVNGCNISGCSFVNEPPPVSYETGDFYGDNDDVVE